MLDLLQGVREYVYPVGRLDFESEGLLILTNDGDDSPRGSRIPATVCRASTRRVSSGSPDARDLHRLARGVVIEGRKTAPADVKLTRSKAGQAALAITVREGRNRQVRKMCDAIGHPVTHLKRVAIGPIQDSRLKPGAVAESDRCTRLSGGLRAAAATPGQSN